MYFETIANKESSNQQIEYKKFLRHTADEYKYAFLANLYAIMAWKFSASEETRLVILHIVCSWGNNVKLVMHQISVDKIENPCYWINRCTFDMVLPSILSTQYWESLIFSPCIVIGEIEHFCVPRGQRRFFIKIEAKASICSWEVCFCCCTH